MMQALSRRDAIRFAGLGAITMGVNGLAGEAGAASLRPSTPFDITPYVNPQLRFLVARLQPLTAVIPTRANLETFRHGPLSYSLPPLPTPAWVEQRIPGSPGNPDVRVCVINARPDGPSRPMILHMHGGGFVMGSARSSLYLTQEIARELDCIVVSVDYRLAPETPFPGSLEDNYAALRWAFKNAVRLGGDPTRIAVMGESAGGGHAAMLAIAARDRGEMPVIYQALIYPMLDDRTGSRRPVPPHIGALIWTPAHNRFGWTALLAVPAGSSRVPIGAVPARLENLKGLPPTFIGVGSIDLFVDENLEYARRLIDSGVATQVEVVPGAFHGFDTIPGPSVGLLFRRTLIAALRTGLAGPR